MKLKTQTLTALMMLGFITSPLAAQLSDGTQKTINIHSKDKHSQQQIDATDTAIKAAVDEYLANERLSDVTEAYNRQVAQLVQSQEAEAADLQSQIDSLEETERAVLPMLNHMVDTLEQFVQQDTPFLLKERQARIERIRALLTRADISVAEKYRQVLEAYTVEVQYGRTLEAYRGEIINDGSQQVTFLRLGRSALYYQTFNGQTGALWQTADQRWQVLNEQQNLVLTQAIQVAQQQQVPSLLNLPMPNMEP